MIVCCGQVKGTYRDATGIAYSYIATVNRKFKTESKQRQCDHVSHWHEAQWMERSTESTRVSQLCACCHSSSVISVKQKSRQKTCKDRELAWAVDSYLDIIMTYPCVLFYPKPSITIVWNGQDLSLGHGVICHLQAFQSFMSS